MRNATQITITNIPEISAVYFALLQCGYSYYAIERSQKHNARIRSFIRAEGVPSFFSRIKQNTCQVYPYWPRAAILETASFYLLPDHSQFRDYDAFRSCIMNAGNILDNDRNQKLWNWIDQFPAALSDVLSSDAFRRYLEWEEKWLAERNIQHEADLRLIKSCLDVCVSKYGSPVQDIQIVVNPIKCVYSSDYHLDGNRFIFCSGAFRVDSAIHEFLHHVVHPAVAQIASWIDYLSFGEIGPGGWADHDGCINCVKSAWDFDSERFRVSLLKHEAQHAMDLQRDKNMSSEDLEYRAKLVELIYSKERNLLNAFSRESDATDQSNGHAMAAYRIMKGYADVLGTDQMDPAKISVEQIQAIARMLFEKSGNKE